MMYAPRQPCRQPSLCRLRGVEWSFSLTKRLYMTCLMCGQFYRLNNVSWLQPMCEYPQNLYSKMNDKQRAVLLPGAWGSTSGPRGGQSW